MLLTSARLWTSWLWLGFCPVLIVDTGLSPVIAGTVVSVQGLTAVAAALVSGVWVRYFGPKYSAVSPSR